MEEKKLKSQAQRWRDFLEILFIAFTLALILRTFVFGFYRVSTGSMAPSLRIGDFVWVSKISYGLKLPFTNVRFFEHFPHKGDLVLFRQPEQPHAVHIKRVIGLPGDHIHIRQHQIFVNEEAFPLEPMAASEFADIPGAEFMRFFKETNDGKPYSVMFAESAGQTKDVGPLVVPPGEIFVMGDNRDASDDSRYWGTIPMSFVEAKMKGIWFSLDWSLLPREKKARVRWDRLRNDF